MFIGLTLLFIINAAVSYFFLYGRVWWKNDNRLFSVGWTVVVALILVFCEIKAFAVPLAALKYLFR